MQQRFGKLRRMLTLTFNAKLYVFHAYITVRELRKERKCFKKLYRFTLLIINEHLLIDSALNILFALLFIFEENGEEFFLFHLQFQIFFLFCYLFT